MFETEESIAVGVSDVATPRASGAASAPGVPASVASTVQTAVLQTPSIVDGTASIPGSPSTASQSSRKHKFEAFPAPTAAVSSPILGPRSILDRMDSPVRSISPEGAAAGCIPSGLRTPRTPTHSARVPRLHIDTTGELCRSASAAASGEGEQKELASASYERTPLYLPCSPLASPRRIVPLPNLPYSLLSTPDVALSAHEFVRAPVRFSNGTRAVVTTRTPFDPDKPEAEKNEHKPKAVVITFPVCATQTSPEGRSEERPAVMPLDADAAVPLLLRVCTGYRR